MFKNSILLLVLYFLGITAFAQTDSAKNSGSDLSSKNNLDNKNYWLIVGVGSLSEVDYETVEGILEYPEYGIDLYFSRKRPGRVIERGFSLGWQPIGTTSAEHSYVTTDTIAGTTDTLSGYLRASNQMIHAYYTPRVTLFKQKSMKLYVEGIVGMKGNALTYRLFDGDAGDNGELVEKDVLELKMTWNAGLAIGTRMDINEKFALDLRYARVYSGALNKIDHYSIEDNVVYTSDWDAPVGYFRIGLNYVY